MKGVLAGVDQRTRLVGENRLELLLFRLGGPQRYGINVFKVQEVLPCPALTKIAHSSPVVRGISHMRGRTISMIDLARAIGKQPLSDLRNCFVIVTEYNRAVQGFLVSGVDRIVNLNWDDIKPPSRGLGKESYMTAVTRVDDELVQIIDVEKVFAELVGMESSVDNQENLLHREARPLRILIVDDSSVARNQIKRTLEHLGIETILANNGREALQQLIQLAEQAPIQQQIDLVISDVEMPQMDGYTLTHEIRSNEKLRQLPLLLHTSLSGVFNKAMIEKVGADRFVPKFNAEELTNEVRQLLQEKNIISAA